MATSKRKMYQVKKDYRGKVKLESGTGSTLLDTNTPQSVLEKLYTNSVLGKGFIELVAAPAVATQTQTNVQTGQ